MVLDVRINGIKGTQHASKKKRIDLIRKLFFGIEVSYGRKTDEVGYAPGPGELETGLVVYLPLMEYEGAFPT